MINGKGFLHNLGFKVIHLSLMVSKRAYARSIGLVFLYKRLLTLMLGTDLLDKVF